MSYQQPNPWQTPRSAADTDPQAEWQRRQDADHLNLLSIFYYVSAGWYGLQTLGVGAYFALLGTVFTSSGPGMRNGEAAAVGSVMLGVGSLACLFSIAVVVLMVYAAKSIKERKNSTLIYIAAGLNCLHVPLGTALGVFTFIVMSRPTVRELFQPGYLSGLYESNR